MPESPICPVSAANPPSNEAFGTGLPTLRKEISVAGTVARRARAVRRQELGQSQLREGVPGVHQHVSVLGKAGEHVDLM